MLSVAQPIENSQTKPSFRCPSIKKCLPFGSVVGLSRKGSPCLHTPPAGHQSPDGEAGSSCGICCGWGSAAKKAAPQHKKYACKQVRKDAPLFAAPAVSLPPWGPPWVKVRGFVCGHSQFDMRSGTQGHGVQNHQVQTTRLGKIPSEKNHITDHRFARRGAGATISLGNICSVPTRRVLTLLGHFSHPCVGVSTAPHFEGGKRPKTCFGRYLDG